MTARRSDAAGAVLGVAGTAIALVALGGGLLGLEPLGAPRTPAEVALTALEMLVGGAALGGVLLAGRRLSPWAPLASALLWAAGSVAVLAAPPILVEAGLYSAATLFGHQIGLALTGLMLLGAFALRPAAAAAPSTVARAAPEPQDTDPHIAAVRPVPTFRAGPQRPNGPGPRHRAPPRRSSAVPLQRWSRPGPPLAAPRPRRRAG